MAFLMLSLGMFSALASATALRRRGFFSGSPPPNLAAITISLMMRVKILPRLASSAPFLCLIECHLEWPDIGLPSRIELDDRGTCRCDAECAAIMRTTLDYIVAYGPFSSF